MEVIKSLAVPVTANRLSWLKYAACSWDKGWELTKKNHRVKDSSRHQGLLWELAIHSFPQQRMVATGAGNFRLLLIRPGASCGIDALNYFLSGIGNDPSTWDLGLAQSTSQRFLSFVLTMTFRRWRSFQADAKQWRMWDVSLWFFFFFNAEKKVWYSNMSQV